MRCLKIAIVVVSAMAASVASAANIYIDFAVTGGNGLPSSSFGGAAGLPGQWNQIDYTESFSTLLVASNGAASGVKIGVTGPGVGGGSLPGATGDDALLLNDMLDSSGSFSLTVRDLPAGTYDFYTYAAHPGTNGDTFTTQVSVDGLAAQSVQRDATFTGYSQGITHALHRIFHDGLSDIGIMAVPDGSVAIINGLQIVEVQSAPVPEPTAVLLLTTGATFLLLARRSRRYA